MVSLVLRYLAALAALAVVGLMTLFSALGPISRAIALACVVASFVLATVLRKKDVRAHASVVAGLAAVIAAGQTKGGWAYGVAAGAFIFVALYVLRASRRSEPVAAPRRPVIIIAATTAAVATVSVLFLPTIGAYVERTVTGMMDVDSAETTAFSTTMTLGATKGMLQSDAIVARIDGEHGGYLRGAVYDRYDGRHWITSAEGRDRTELRSEKEPGTSRITLDRHAPVGVDMRWFLPPNACHFDRSVDVDTFGVVRRGPGAIPATLGYSITGCTPPAIRGPTANDVDIMHHVMQVVGPLSNEWTAGATTDHEKLKAIEKHLATYEYSLAVDRTQDVDSIVDFLTIHRAGHCEYFASAMVMLARAQHIPARVVGGYRVTEVNSITGQLIVRDRNAHAWVETFEEDHAWHEWDPTPVSDEPWRGRSFLDSLSDLWALAMDRVSQFGPLDIAVALGVLIAILFAIRALTSWVRTPARRRTQQAMERPLPCFETLTDALRAAGFVRDDSEPIEAFAARVPVEEAARALIAYAALRYGGVGAEDEVARIAERAAKAVTSARS